MHTALTIAGSDSGGGAGIQADLKAFSANGVFGMSVITAITAQNTLGVTAAMNVEPTLIEAQVDAVFDDLPVGAVKTGMLASAETVQCVAQALAARRPTHLVVDPVMISSTGFSLVDDDAIHHMRTALFPLASLLTPNAHEAARLVGFEVNSLAQAARAAKLLGESGAGAVLVKGGHLRDETHSVDTLWDGERIHTFQTERISTNNTHGTGCTTAAAIAANLAKGHALVDAVARTKRYVHGAIAAGLDLGAGSGPTHHFWFAQGTGLFPIDD